MYDIVRAKFTQNEEIQSVLLSTAGCKLVEHTANDSYWGDGGDGRGKNKLGLTLMRVRDEMLAGPCSDEAEEDGGDDELGIFNYNYTDP